MDKFDLQTFAAENPADFLAAFKIAVEGVGGLSEARKFMWGETGVDPFAGPPTGATGDQILTLIEQAVAGINLDGAATDNTGVASAFKAMVDQIVQNSIKNSGLVNEVVNAAAPMIGEAIAGVMKASAEKPNDLIDFELPDTGDVVLTGYMPNNA